MPPRILFYVQHLLGIGHLVRAGRVATALAARFEVEIVVGGLPPPGFAPEGVAMFALPPVRAGADGFSALAHPDGRPFGSADQARRRDILLGRYEAFRPDVVLIEAFPFGRRPMRFELLPLLDRIASSFPRPLVVCSVRDILQETRPERRVETVTLLRRHFDLVLVHGDPHFATLSDSFPEASGIADLVQYTGLVGPRPSGDTREGGEEADDVVVSVGGGAVGAHLVDTALAARPLSCLAGARWLVLTGPNAPARTPSDRERALSIRRFVPDLATRLARARVSVSQAGYNTVADILAARCRAVLVPFAAAGEVEQSRRAALLAKRGRAVVVEERDLGPETLAAALDRALALPDPGTDLALDGAEQACRLLGTRLGFGV